MACASWRGQIISPNLNFDYPRRGLNAQRSASVPISCSSLCFEHSEIRAKMVSNNIFTRRESNIQSRVLSGTIEFGQDAGVTEFGQIGK